MMILSTTFALTYLIEQGIEWYFHLVLSPETLILRCIPVLLGLSYFVPAIFEYVTSRGSLRQSLNNAIAKVCEMFVDRFRGRQPLCAVPSHGSLTGSRPSGSPNDESVPLLSCA